MNKLTIPIAKRLFGGAERIGCQRAAIKCNGDAAVDAIFTGHLALWEAPALPDLRGLGLVALKQAPRALAVAQQVALVGSWQQTTREIFDAKRRTGNKIQQETAYEPGGPNVADCLPPQGVYVPLCMTTATVTLSPDGETATALLKADPTGGRRYWSRDRADLADSAYGDADPKEKKQTVLVSEKYWRALAELGLTLWTASVLETKDYDASILLIADGCVACGVLMPARK